MKQYHMNLTQVKWFRKAFNSDFLRLLVIFFQFLLADLLNGVIPKVILIFRSFFFWLIKFHEKNIRVCPTTEHIYHERFWQIFLWKQNLKYMCLFLHNSKSIRDKILLLKMNLHGIQGSLSSKEWIIPLKNIVTKIARPESSRRFYLEIIQMTNFPHLRTQKWIINRCKMI